MLQPRHHRASPSAEFRRAPSSGWHPIFEPQTIAFKIAVASQDVGEPLEVEAVLEETPVKKPLIP